MLQAKVSVWEEDIDRVSPRPIAEKREANSWKLSGRCSTMSEANRKGGWD